MTAASLRSGDTICWRGEDINLRRVRRIYSRGTGKCQFVVDAEILSTREHITFNSTDSVLLIERNRVKDRYGK